MEINDRTFEAEVLKSELPVLVEFWASWCPPCKMMGPLFDQVKTKTDGKIKMCKINVDLNPEKADEYVIAGVPTFILFKKGKEISRKVGALSEPQINEMFSEVIK